MADNEANPKYTESDGADVELLSNRKYKSFQDINETNSSNLNKIKNEEDCEYPGERVKFEGLSENGSLSSESNDELPPIPDGGWGWVVVASAFIISACVDGVAFSFGLLQEEFTTYFESSNSKTSLIGGLFISTPLLSGPIMSALVDKYGCRLMTMVAGLLSTIGFLLAAVSNSVEMLCLTYGLISGLAMGILYVTAIVPVAFWFDKKRNFAVSLASCGIGVGTLIYSPLTYFLLNVYDWRNTVVILAGTLLNMCVCGAVMRDPDWLIVKQTRKRKARKMRMSSVSSVSSKSIGEESFFTPEELKDLIQSGKSPEYILHTLATTIAEAEQLEATTQMNAEQSCIKRMHSHIHLPTFIQQNEKVPVEVIQKLLGNKSLYNIIIKNHPDIMTRRRSEINFGIQDEEAPSKDKVNDPVAVTIKIKKTDINTNEQNKEESISLIRSGDDHERDLETGETVYKKTINSDSCNIQCKKSNKINNNTEITHIESTKINNRQNKTVKDLNWFVNLDQSHLKGISLRHNLRNRRTTIINFPNYKSHATSLPNIYENSTWSLGSESDDEWKWYRRLWRTVLKTFDVRMFNELHFMMFNLSSIILSAWFIVPYFFLTSYMTAMNLEGGALMISIIGVASCIGIVALGWAGDKPWVNVPKAYTFCIVICGLSVASYPLFITNFWALAVISSIFGLTFASSYSYIPAMLLELMPVDHFTVAYGLILFSEGVGHLIGPPLAGWFFDISGKWELTFYIGGFWIVISGLCVGVIAYTKNIKIFGTGPLLKDLEDKNKATEVPFHV